MRDENALAQAIDAKVGVANGLAMLDANGKVPADQLGVTQPPDASTTQKGIVKLNDTVTSTSVSEAATANAVKTAYDEALAGKQLGVEQKANVVAALNSIGVPASTSESWAQLIPKISAVIRATGNATAADVLAGKTASNANGPFTGQMPNRSAENNHMPGLEPTVWPGDRFFIRPPHGYYDGASWVTAAVPGLTANNLRSGVNVAGLIGTLVEGRPFIKGYGMADLNIGALIIPIPEGFNPGLIRIWRDREGYPDGLPMWASMVPSDHTASPYIWLNPNTLRWEPVTGYAVYGPKNTTLPGNALVYGVGYDNGVRVGNHYEIIALN
ncbi:phage tail protein [Paenibacillus sp. DMB20]|uniref:phage tail protein n=1 Tax=Paenibacillus sp. DMB20 TaxID=1642570 RepID=UPI0006281113|nr:tail fiber protein [Paenibacillus sp. DMB20]KKO54513.1 hypothetical protein XI25_06970 [Paenibacillus sp. DMB20]